MNQFSMFQSIVSNIETGPRAIFVDGSNYIARSSDVRTGVVSGINREAETELRHFVKLIFNSSRIFHFGATYEEFFSTVCGKLIKDFSRRDGSLITQAELSQFETEIRDVLLGQQATRDVFVPCVITTYPAAHFSVGPVQFTFINNFAPPNSTLDFNQFARVLESMRAESVFWMATASISKTTSNRGLELADLTVDLALTGLQLVMPLAASSRISRMSAKRTPIYRDAIWLSEGNIGGSGSNQQPAAWIGPGYLDQIISDGSKVLTSAGNRVNAYLAENPALPRLNLAWCDAAYWFHEGFAEPIGSIAVSKLVAAVEVLLKAVSTSNITPLLAQTIRIFFGVSEDENLFLQPRISVKEFIKDAVKSRSRILHGDWSTLNTDLSETRDLLTLFLLRLLALYAVELDGFISSGAGTDDLQAFLHWIDQHRNPARGLSTDLNK